MTENVGKVTLDLTYYPGDDKYCDGDIENEILDIVQNHTKEEYPDIICEKKSWPVFYHLSSFRSNIVDWLPFEKTDKVLEIGSGCGAITGSVADKVASVTCIDLSKKRSLINAYRNKDKDNITIMVGNFQDIEPHLECDYDYVLLIGVFEYGKAYIGGKNPYEDFMAICNRHRKPTGRLVIAIENKFGLKYFAGCKEDHVSEYFAGIEGYPNGGMARTFTRRGLEQIMNRVGIDQYSFYYPYPDYKFTSVLYSDRYLPRQGELTTNLRNFDNNRMLLFDEKQVFDQIILEQEFSLFSNSYLVVIGKEPELIYSKFSNDRALPWAINTSIYENVFGEKYVEKTPYTSKARGHIANTARAYENLSKRYKNTKIEINECMYKNNKLVFPYCYGDTLENMLDACLARTDIAGFKTLIEEYMSWVGYGEDMAVSNIDFTFPNIIIEGDKWQVIDYEWTFDRKIPVKDIAFRAFYNYIIGSSKRQMCKELLFNDILGFTAEEIEAEIKEENEFQHYINGDRATIGDMRELIGFKVYDAKEIEAIKVYQTAKYRMQLFFDQGEGFSEDNSVYISECFKDSQTLSLEYKLPAATKHVRIDPANYACAVEIHKLGTDIKEYASSDMMTNGIWVSGQGIVFDTTDPNIALDCEGASTLRIEMTVQELTIDMAGALVQKITQPTHKRRLFGV